MEREQRRGSTRVLLRKIVANPWLRKFLHRQQSYIAVAVAI